MGPVGARYLKKGEAEGPVKGQKGVVVVVVVVVQQ